MLDEELGVHSPKISDNKPTDISQVFLREALTTTISDST